MSIRPVCEQDREFWMSVDHHCGEEDFRRLVLTETGYVLRHGETSVGLMWYLPIWNSMPFLNLIYILEEYRGKGFGRAAMEQWEQEMRRKGYRLALISTQVDEEAQHFYRRLGYVDCGGLLLDHTPLNQPMEMFMKKTLEQV